MRVLVTGGAGYIGSVTAQLLVDTGYEVEVLDDLSTGHTAALSPGVPFHAGNLNDADFLDTVFRRPFDAIMHFAAFSLVAESVAEPCKYYRNNVGGTLALIEKVAAGSASRFVFSSSAAVYGEPKTIPIPETTALAPVNPYGRTKLAMEWALADAAKAYDFAAVALRYFNAAGASGALGEDHLPESHLIPRLLRSLVDADVEFQIFGDDYDTPDGTCIRDYIHVVDLAEAHVAALAWAERPGFTAINLGTATGYSVGEVVQEVSRVTGQDLSPPVVARRAGDPARLVAANARARRLLGWAPRRSDLAAIVSDAWDWHRRHPRGYLGDSA